MATHVIKQERSIERSSMNGTDLENQVITCMMAGGRPIVWGPPGVGKTAMAHSIQRKLGLPMIHVLIGSTSEPSDVGLPVLSKNMITVDGIDYPTIEYAVPNWALELSKRGGLLVIDELTSCAPAMQASYLRLIQEGRVGNYPLPMDTVYILALANPPDQAAGGWEMALPMKNRVVHMQYRLDANSWADNFVNYWGCPPVIKFMSKTLDEAKWKRARMTVASFIRSQPMYLLMTPDASTISTTYAYPTPRSWDMVSRILAVSPDVSTRDTLIKGAIGDNASNVFINYLEQMDLPDPEEIIRAVLANPMHFAFEVPNRLDRQDALMSSIVEAVRSKPSNDRGLAAWKVIERFLNAGCNEVAINYGAALTEMYLNGGRNPAIPAPPTAISRRLGMLTED